MANAALLLDYLFLRGRIVDRIRLASLGGPSVEVLPIEDVTDAIERSTRTSSVFVLWEGDGFPTGPDGRMPSAQILRQSWTVLLAVRNASQHTGDARDQSAGALLSGLHRCIAGWTPEGATRPFLRGNGRQARYGGNVALYPLTFSIDLYL